MVVNVQAKTKNPNGKKEVENESKFLKRKIQA
jgi:hypothetical protein